MKKILQKRFRRTVTRTEESGRSRNLVDYRDEPDDEDYGPQVQKSRMVSQRKNKRVKYTEDDPDFVEESILRPKIQQVRARKVQPLARVSPSILP